ncbi:MAG: hypothetical protein ACAI38_19050 [Myxococcota bacterium]
MSAMKKPQKHLQVCPKCAAYMQPQSPIETKARHNWKDETYHRAFGGVELRKFVCEKCGHIEVYQVDDLAGISEDN